MIESYYIKKRLNRLKIPIIIAIILLLISFAGEYFLFVRNEEVKLSKSTKTALPKICPDGCPEESACPAVLECTPNPPSGEAMPASGAYEGALPGTSATTPSASPSPTPAPTPAPQESPDIGVNYVMGSTNYRMQSDSLNSGGLLSTSTNYRIEDTLGESATGESNASGTYMHAGYQQMNEIYISISSSGNVNLGNIGGVTGGLANGSSILTVKTDSPSGYSMTARASTNPALKRIDDSFDNYTESSPGVPDYTWSVAANSAEFGFSPKGTDITSMFKDNNSDACSTGSSQTADKCWYKLVITNLTIASSTAPNHPAGTATTVHFQSESAAHYLLPGDYTATVTFTATTN